MKVLRFVFFALVLFAGAVLAVGSADFDFYLGGAVLGAALMVLSVIKMITDNMKEEGAP